MTPVIRFRASSQTDSPEGVRLLLLTGKPPKARLQPRSRKKNLAVGCPCSSEIGIVWRPHNLDVTGVWIDHADRVEPRVRLKDGPDDSPRSVNGLRVPIIRVKPIAAIDWHRPLETVVKRSADQARAVLACTTDDELASVR